MLIFSAMHHPAFAVRPIFEGKMVVAVGRRTAVDRLACVAAEVGTITPPEAAHQEWRMAVWIPQPPTKPLVFSMDHRRNLKPSHVGFGSYQVVEAATAPGRMVAEPTNLEIRFRQRALATVLCQLPEVPHDAC